jgi:hypothetical protein
MSKYSCFRKCFCLNIIYWHFKFPQQRVILIVYVSALAHVEKVPVLIPVSVLRPAAAMDFLSLPRECILWKNMTLAPILVISD